MTVKRTSDACEARTAAYRYLSLLPRNTGWPEGTARFKANAAANLFNGEPRRIWYDEIAVERLSRALLGSG